MAKNLVIVESPAKARTIGQFLGKDYQVTSSYGHIRDLPKKGLSVDTENHFIPTYEVPQAKKKQLRELKKQTKTATTVWLATDEDREGEAIAWHLCEALNLSAKDTKRIVFHEVTAGAIQDAIKKPRFIDSKLVDAQQARRILDRLVGYELSPVLWKKVRRGLSAGRVQSVAVRLVAERESEIEAFKPVSAYKVSGEFESHSQIFTAELGEKLEDEANARAFLKKLVSAEFTVAALATKPSIKSPPPPFTTSTLQQAAATRLGFSVKQTMVLAQRLYEAGKITYMRTDSLNLAASAITQAEQQIKHQFGPEYVKTRQFKTKSRLAQEAHEAIRPTDFSQETAGGDSNEQRLYRLIRRRALASQMVEAKLKKTDISIRASNVGKLFKAKGEVITFGGFLKVYGDILLDAGNDLLPPLKVDERVTARTIQALESLSKPPARYTEAALVKKLEVLGIGRPSTFAPTISTIQDRDYVEKGQSPGLPRVFKRLVLQNEKISGSSIEQNVGSDAGKLLPTPTGKLVNKFLVKHFPEVVDYNFTATVEADFDKVARGLKPWNTMIADFYKPFHKTVAKSESITRAEASESRQIGIDPATKKPIFARYGRFGPMVQLGVTESEEKPRFAPLPTGKTVENVSLEEALKMLALPRIVGKTSAGEEISANFGRFGPYIQIGKTYIAIKPDDPFSIALDRALELIKEKKQSDLNKYIRRFEKAGISVINGRFGPYITNGKKNAKVPKDKPPAELTLKDCQEILKKAPAKPRRFATKRQ